MSLKLLKDGDDQKKNKPHLQQTTSTNRPLNLPCGKRGKRLDASRRQAVAKQMSGKTQKERQPIRQADKLPEEKPHHPASRQRMKKAPVLEKETNDISHDPCPAADSAAAFINIRKDAAKKDNQEKHYRIF